MLLVDKESDDMSDILMSRVSEMVDALEDLTVIRNIIEETVAHCESGAGWRLIFPWNFHRCHVRRGRTLPGKC